MLNKKVETNSERKSENENFEAKTSQDKEFLELVNSL